MVNNNANAFDRLLIPATGVMMSSMELMIDCLFMTGAKHLNVNTYMVFYLFRANEQGWASCSLSAQMAPLRVSGITLLTTQFLRKLLNVAEDVLSIFDKSQFRVINSWKI